VTFPKLLQIPNTSEFKRELKKSQKHQHQHPAFRIGQMPKEKSHRKKKSFANSFILNCAKLHCHRRLVRAETFAESSISSLSL
jgi:hypothetical protein